MDVRARHAAVGDVAANRDLQPLDPAGIRRLIVSASRSACVGCSWRPSPALMTAASTCWLRSCAAPEQLCLTTRICGCMALSVVAVSSSVSPFFTEDPATLIFSTEPPRCFAASSNDTRVRVEFSKIDSAPFCREECPTMAVQAAMVPDDVGEHVAAINQAHDLERVETFNAKKMTRCQRGGWRRAW